ncbi:MAG: hypothetical protein V1494_05560 [Candidatus Diapherotrites archaeon]
MSRIISSFDRFEAALKDTSILKTDSARTEALKNYFAKGGVISIAKPDSGWPKLVYPSPLRVKSQIDELNALRQQFSGKKSKWSMKNLDAKAYHIKHNVLKLSDPLYWKHMAKIVSDRDYRSDSASVKLPAHLVSDKRWKPMIRMFVNDIEYRKQLTETVQHSIVYKKDKRVGAYADELKEFRVDVSQKEIGGLDKKIKGLDEQLKSFDEILKWAKEK